MTFRNDYSALSVILGIYAGHDLNSIPRIQDTLRGTI